jgi:putative ABC transport system permease protein
MRGLVADLRVGFRSLVRKPGLSVVAIVTLALGIGASTAIFSVVDAALLRALPYREPERLVMAWEVPPENRRKQNVINLGNLEDWKAQSRTLGSFAAFLDTPVALAGDGEPEQVPAQLATPELFQVLGAEPLLGRTFAPDDGKEGQPRAVVLGYGLWQRRFGGDPAVVGRAIQVNERAATVVGVMPPGFTWHVKEGSRTRKSAELWSAWQPTPEMKLHRGRFAMAVARLAPGATVEEAQAEMRTIAARLEKQYPDFDAKWSATVTPLREQLSGVLRPSLLVLFGAVGFLLLIACANVTNLLLARATARQREVAVRAALGAGRGRIVRQLLTESVILALAAGLVGAGVAAWGIEVLVRLSPPELGDLPPVAINLPVLAFALALSFATGVIFGLAPALAATRVDLGAALKEGGRDSGGPRRHRLRGALVVLETALALMLLVGAGLLAKSYARLAAVDPGFDPERVLTLRVSLPSARYTEEKLVAFAHAAAERLGAIPGVDSAGTVSFLPFAGPASGTTLEIEGQPPRPKGSERVTGVNIADAAFFRALRIPLLRGRLFSADEERVARHVVIVNEAFVRAYFPSEDPIAMKDVDDPTTIIGVVGDSKHAALDRAVEPMAYWPQPELPMSSLTFVLHSTGDAAALGPAARRALAELDPQQPVADVREMTSLLSRSIAQARFNTFVLMVFAAVALLLAAVGIAGVMAVAVAQRTREIGIRMALGARASQVVAQVVRQGIALALAGVALGVAGALVVARLLGALLYGVAATDPPTFALVAGGLVVVALLACAVPARRAAQVDPMIALRAE